MSEIDALLRFYKGRKFISVKDITEFRDTMGTITYASPRLLPVTYAMVIKVGFLAADAADSKYDRKKQECDWNNTYWRVYVQELRAMTQP